MRCRGKEIPKNKLLKNVERATTTKRPIFGSRNGPSRGWRTMAHMPGVVNFKSRRNVPKSSSLSSSSSSSSFGSHIISRRPNYEPYISRAVIT